jgi:chromosome segregation ATPase
VLIVAATETDILMWLHFFHFRCWQACEDAKKGDEAQISTEQQLVAQSEADMLKYERRVRALSDEMESSGKRVVKLQTKLDDDWERQAVLKEKIKEAKHLTHEARKIKTEAAIELAKKQNLVRAVCKHTAEAKSQRNSCFCTVMMLILHSCV